MVKRLVRFRCNKSRTSTPTLSPLVLGYTGVAGDRREYGTACVAELIVRGFPKPRGGMKEKGVIYSEKVVGGPKDEKVLTYSFDDNITLVLWKYPIQIEKVRGINTKSSLQK